ncbi:MAG: 2Fe-2S iron-sulfur cluster-binding protein, partial [Calditrichia bacterium]
MSKIQVFIDGKPVIAESGQTILQVCREQNIEIPTLCYDDQLEPFTSCFLCVVQVEGARTFVPSCGTKIAQGMNITTSNESIVEARKMVLELILSNHYADCLGPCKISCPAGVDVQGYLALAAMGRYRDAIELIKRNNPLPTVCGRVCTRPCELNCRRNLIDEPAAIDHVKRYIADLDMASDDRYFPQVKPDTGLNVAIVGSGPAGLSCAYYLRQEGHTVDIFDAKPKAGGMLRWGIPQYRLPEAVLNQEIAGVTKLGVDI